jgi:hypothetical protein
MARPKHIALLAQGVNEWNQWREQYPATRPNLSKADLRGADLHRANLALADLTGANLSRANLTRAVLSEATLRDADFSYSTLNRTTFGDVDLSSAIGLATVEHQGPSTIGLDAIYRSQGKIPESFLRGAGVPENFITYMKSLTGTAIEFYSCFISYSMKDQKFVERIYADLQANGVRCWFAPSDVQSGRKIHEQIDEAIKVHDKLLLVLSDASMNSEWVKREIAIARERERREKVQLLFPVSLAPFETIRRWEAVDSDSGENLAKEIREYFIPDFSQWANSDSYRQSFLLLLRNLTATGRRREGRHA